MESRSIYNRQRKQAGLGFLPPAAFERWFYKKTTGSIKCLVSTIDDRPQLNRRPKTGFEVVAVRRQVSGFTANPSLSSGAGKSGEKIVSLVGLEGSGGVR